MKILDVKSLEIPDIKVIRFARFHDHRGYFTEQFRKSDLSNRAELGSIKDIEFVQGNESYSKKGTVRGLHFQWNPYMGKLVRILSGQMIDLALDIRKGAPTYGNIIAYEMSTSEENEADEWLWVPPGFAHGFCFPENSLIEYLCSGEYNPNCETGISPLSKDLDWSLCDKRLKQSFYGIAEKTDLITEKDRNAQTLGEWNRDERAENFIYFSLKEERLC